MNNTRTTSPDIFRLTALWALCESGLGGWMHALHLPFTGFFVGGFAVIIISLIALYSDNSLRQVLQATTIVLLVKASVSPYSPWQAYVAVGFQGVLGAVLFRFLSFKPAAILFGILAMLESALQMVIMATLIFGKALWETLDKFFKELVTDLHLSQDISYSLWIIVAYAGIYALWGLLLGIWMIRLPGQLSERAESIMQRLPAVTATPTETSARGGRYIKLITGAVVLAIIVGVLLWYGESLGRAAYVVIRTVLVFALLVFIVNPLFRLLMRRLAKRSTTQNAVAETIRYLPQLRLYLRPAYTIALEQKNAFAKFRAFLITLIVLTLYSKHSDQ